MDRDAIASELERPIPENAKFTRRGGAGELTYVDGAYVIDSLNAIFGWDGWDFSCKESVLIRLEQLEDGKNKGKWLCLHSYIGELTVHLDMGPFVTKAGEACGSGLSFNPTEAVHFALTEAATDALKRAARLLGGRMGLELYRKHGNLSQVPLDPEEISDEMRMFAEAIAKLRDRDAVPALSHEIKTSKSLAPPELEELRRLMTKKLRDL